MFEKLSHLPPDPLLGLISKYNADENPQKVDLGVGVYRDAHGNTPVLRAVKAAEDILLRRENSKVYVGPAGNLAYNRLVAELLLGMEHPVWEQGRVISLQTPGGCGALRVGAELLKRADPGRAIWVSDPTWANHVPLLGQVGLELKTYPYYNFDTHAVDFRAMIEGLQQASAGDVVLLHACCHNPSGADLSREQWVQIVDLCLERQLLPLIDSAYQGFGDDLEGDAFGPRLAAQKLPEVVMCLSCSKNFGLYRERVGAVVLVARNKTEAEAAMTHLASITRALYSMPPSHGASVVAEILQSEVLRDQWLRELTAMSRRLRELRDELAGRMRELIGVDSGGHSRFDFIRHEKGMFSFLGITEQQVSRLALEFSIYMAASSRICLAGLNPHNIEYFSSALASIL